MTTHERPVGTLLLALAGLLSLAAAMGIGRFAFTPVLPLMLGEGLLDVAQGGWLAAANYAGYLAGALTASRVPLRAGALAVVALIATATFTAAMALPLPPLWLPLRFLAGAASAWVFVATSVWCLGALAGRGAARASGWVYAGVGAGIALAGIHCLLAAAAGVRSQPLWLQLGGLALVLALPVLWVIARLEPVGASRALDRPQRLRCRRREHARHRRLLRIHGLRLHPAGDVPARDGAQRGRRPARVRPRVAHLRRDGGASRRWSPRGCCRDRPGCGRGPAASC